MSTLIYILVFTFLGSVVSLIGGVVLLYREKFAIKISHFLSSFAAGVLLGTAFFDLLPEASEGAGGGDIFLWTLIGILGMFLTERLVHWFHHHQHKHESSKDKKSIIPLIVISDVAHNFIDGIVIAATFIASIPLGIVTSIAVIAHEIPQEIGDFGILLHRGMARKKVLLINIASALTAIFGAVIAFSFGEVVEVYLPSMLSLAAGFFIYIAASDLIPEIHSEERRIVALVETLFLLFGVVLIWFLVTILEHSVLV